jgi:hypothetical protein
MTRDKTRNIEIGFLGASVPKPKKTFSAALPIYIDFNLNRYSVVKNPFRGRVQNRM